MNELEEQSVFVKLCYKLGKKSYTAMATVNYTMICQMYAYDRVVNIDDCSITAN